MQRRILALTGAILIACGLAQTALAGSASVTIDNFTFSPSSLTVPVGTKVTWTNRDDIPHTVTDAAEPKSFRSPPLDTGDAFSHVFSSAGTYRYFCSLHPHMQGTVVVK
jgi:plastocyanin